MTDKQCRDRIVGALSVSMMPMEQEAECVRFLDRCLEQASWHSAEQLPPMKDESFEDLGELISNEASDPVLGYTEDQKMVVVTASKSDNRIYWTDDNGTSYSITHWRKLPVGPEE